MKREREVYIQIAQRENNQKRSYLLVNPLQAKHIPASPFAALDMMDALGELIGKNYPDTRLVIGFAETATAIGAAVAGRFDGCFYLQTTREELKNGERWVDFSEEHSHATEQKLCVTNFAIALEKTPCVVFVDDEITTGKTLVNIIAVLREKFPLLNEKTTVIASVVNRVSPANEERLKNANIHSVQLLKMPYEDYSARAAGYSTQPPQEILKKQSKNSLHITKSLPLDPRTGVSAGDYRKACFSLAQNILKERPDLKKSGEILVLGTEECMYPALALARTIEETSGEGRVFCHATTRSPISVSTADGYPIKNGYRLTSFYDPARTTYLYNARHYDKVIVLTDAPNPPAAAEGEIRAVFEDFGCTDFTFIRGVKDV